MSDSAVLDRILAVSEKSGFKSLAVAFYDYETELRFSYRGERTVHAASTIKAAILLGVLKAAEQGEYALNDHLHVRNRFHSVVDGSVYRIETSRDGDSEVHRKLGQAMPIERLARAMIARSSNLATNLLLDFVGVEKLRKTMDEAGLQGIEIRRGVEDTVAFEAGVNNEVTADGLLRLFRVFWDGSYLREESRKRAMDILFAQEFNSMIPAKLPSEAKVAHKTGEISSVCHDAGIVVLPRRKPYIIAVLTETRPNQSGRQKSVAEIAAAVHDHLCGTEEKLNG